MLVTLSLTNKRTDNGSGDYSLYIFEGSDWCANCKRLENTVLNNVAFLELLHANKIELVRVDFPQRKRLSKDQINQNKLLAVKYKFKGVFPSVILSRTDRFLYKKIIYQNQSVDEFSKQVLTVKNNLNQ